MKSNNAKKCEKSQGFTLVESLISIAIIGFVIVSILNGFTYQQLNTKNISAKNIAVSLAEARLEELLKFPGSSLTDGTTVDYIIQDGNSLSEYATDPNQDNQLRRTTVITTSGNLKVLRVTVAYGRIGTTYPFSVTLSTQRGG